MVAEEFGAETEVLRGDEQSLSAWQVYGRIRNLNARKYLLAVAAHHDEDGFRLLKKLGIVQSKDSNAANLMSDWRSRYPGFAELETRLKENPAMAGRFLSICLLPQATKYMADVLTGEIRGNRQEAAKFIINISGAARADARLTDGQMQKAAPNTRTLLSRFDAVEEEEEND